MNGNSSIFPATYKLLENLIRIYKAQTKNNVRVKLQPNEVTAYLKYREGLLSDIETAIEFTDDVMMIADKENSQSDLMRLAPIKSELALLKQQLKSEVGDIFRNMYIKTYNKK